MKTLGKTNLLLALFVSLFTISAFAQAPEDRSSVKNAIQKWGSCRNVAITRTLGDAAIANKHDYVAEYVPSEMFKKLKSLFENDNYIDDITLTESGKWVILYDTNDAAWSAGVPQAMVDAIIEFNENDYYVTSISFNDNGQWAVVSREDVKTSSDELTEWLNSYTDVHGDLWTVTIGEDGIFAVYQSGYAKRGEIPEDLIEALQNSELDYYRVKFAGSSWFFADEEGNYQYSM